VGQQAAAIEQLRRAGAACRYGSSAPGTSPPPLYGPGSPSTELAHSEDLDELSPGGAGTRDRSHSAPLHSHVHTHHGHFSHDPRERLIQSALDGRPGSAASAGTAPPSMILAPPTPKHRVPSTPPSHGREHHHDAKRLKTVPSENPSQAASPASQLPFSAVTLSLPPFRTTVSGGKGRPSGGRTNTHVLWTPQEDACLRALVEEHGEQAWALVASRMPHERNNKQCRERWRNHLRPQCNKGPWTEEEDQIILERVQQHGTKWARISGMYLPDRPENDIKNRWHILIRLHQQPQLPGMLAAACSSSEGSSSLADATFPPVAHATIEPID